MKTIPITEIQISPDRQRKAFPIEYLDELRESIKEDGLFNALVVREEEEGLILVQGECRLRAIQDLYDLGGLFTYDGEPVPPGEVPYTTLGDLDPLRRAIAEFHENIKRRDLHWSERAAATAEIYALRQKEAEDKGLPAPGIISLTREVRDIPKATSDADLGSAHTATRREVILAGLLDDPDIKSAKTRDEAWKIAKRKEERVRNTALAESVGRAFSSDLHQLLNEDSLLWLEKAPGDQFDVILSDPPYGIGADEFGDSGGKTGGQHTYEDSYESWLDVMAVLPAALYRVAKPQCHCYLFCDIDRFHELHRKMESAGWWTHRTPIIWIDPGKPRVPWPEHGPQRKYELVLYAVKGKKTVNSIAPDVVTYPADKNLGHQAQKPVALYADLLRRSVKPGDRVLDAFAGSGPIIPAGHGLKCTVTALEKDPAAFGLMVTRLKALKTIIEEPKLEGLE